MNVSQLIAPYPQRQMHLKSVCKYVSLGSLPELH